MFSLVAPELEKYLRLRFPDLAFGVDPDIYLSAVYETLTDYFKTPEKYDPAKSGLLTYLKLASWRDLRNLLRKESRHTSGRVRLEDVEFSHSDGNDISERVAEDLDNQRLVADLTQGMTSDEQAVFDLMMEGERSTRVAAEAMNIGHMSSEEQARQVKRVKDRIKKRIRRRGMFQS
jgi:DNA-directed RNA polymerase specialized sigma24 family protein